jgi:hypothetical protein
MILPVKSGILICRPMHFDFRRVGRAARDTNKQSNRSAKRWLERTGRRLCKEATGPRLADGDLFFATGEL